MSILVFVNISSFYNLLELHFLRCRYVDPAEAGISEEQLRDIAYTKVQ